MLQRTIYAGRIEKAAKYHPDAGGDAWAFQQIQDAFDALINPDAVGTKEPESQLTTELVEVPMVDTATVKLNASTKRHSPRRKKRRKNDVIGIIFGGVLAVIVGGGFWVWYENFLKDQNRQAISANPEASSLRQSGTNRPSSREKASPDPQQNRQPDPTPPDLQNPVAEDSANVNSHKVRAGNSKSENERVAANEPDVDPVPANTGLELKETPEFPADMPEVVIDFGFREWSDSNEKFKTQAMLDRILEDKLVLKMPSGESVEVPLSRLSDEDQEYATRLEKQLTGLFAKAEEQLVFAKHVQAFYQQLELEAGQTSLQRDFIAKRLGEIKYHSDRDHLMYDGTYISRAKLEGIRARRTNSWTSGIGCSN